MGMVLGSDKVLEALIALLWGPTRSWKVSGKGFGSYKVLEGQWTMFWGPIRSWKLQLHFDGVLEGPGSSIERFGVR